MLMLTMHQTRPLLLWLPLIALVVVHLHGILLLLVTAPLLSLALFLSRLRFRLWLLLLHLLGLHHLLDTW